MLKKDKEIAKECNIFLPGPNSDSSKTKGNKATKNDPNNKQTNGT